MMADEQFASIWDAIEDMLAEAENMKLRSASKVDLTARPQCGSASSTGTM